MATNDKIVDKLNRLVEVNMDRKEGYLKAVENSDDASLKSLFQQYAETSDKYRADLVTAVQTLGGTPSEKTTVGGDVYRAWMDVKDALSSNDRKSVLASCERGEDSALSTYRNVLDDHDGVDASVLGALTAQLNNLEKAHDHIKALRDKEQ